MSKLKTRSELCCEFGVSYKTLKKRLDAHGISLPKGHVNPRWQKLIYELLYYPDGISLLDYADVRLPTDWKDD